MAPAAVARAAPSDRLSGDRPTTAPGQHTRPPYAGVAFCLRGCEDFGEEGTRPEQSWAIRVRMRRLLKVALQALGFRCVEFRAVAAPEGQVGARDSNSS
jgi:hypothetical protein